MTTTPKPPEALGAAGKRLWQAYVSEFDFQGDAHALRLLATACAHADAAATLQNAIDRDGAVGRDRWDAPRVHPGIKEARSERTAMVACLKSIGLDLLPVADVGRPAGR